MRVRSSVFAVLFSIWLLSGLSQVFADHSFSNSKTYVIENPSYHLVNPFYLSDSAQTHIHKNAVQWVLRRKDQFRDDLQKNIQFPSIGIVGGGPSGLITALHAYKAGSPIFLWEKREHYTRSQIIILQPDLAKEFKDLIGDARFNFLVQNEVLIPTHVIYSTDYKRALSFPSTDREIRGFSEKDLKKLESALSPVKNTYTMQISDFETELAFLIDEIAILDPNSMYFEKGTEVSGYHFNGNQLCPDFKLIKSPPLDGPSRHCFDWLIGADSFRSSIARQAHLEETEVASPVAHTVMGLFDRPDGWPKYLDGVLMSPFFESLSPIRYLLSPAYRDQMQDQIHLLIFARQNTIYMGLDLNEKSYTELLRDSDNPELTATRITDAIRKEFERIHPEMAHLSKDLHLKRSEVKLRAAAFPIQLIRRKKLTRTYGDPESPSSAVFLMGDAQWTFHYFSGNGITTALNSSFLIEKGIRKIGHGEMTLLEFTKKYDTEILKEIKHTQKSVRSKLRSFFDN